MATNKPLLRIALLSSLALFSGGLAVFSGLYLYLSPKLPSVETLRQVKLQTPLRVYSADGILIGEFGEMRRSPIHIEDAPPLFIKAILAAEDDRFYSHHGVDIKGLLRAASQLLQSGQIQTGGSTITMQVARNFFLTSQQTFSRKFNEILLALQIERELTKEEILELYINKIYLGNRAYGIQSAALTYYGKNINDLDLAQLAMIAGLPKAPSAYNPIVNPSRSLIRRNWILGRMLELNLIDAATHSHAIKQPNTASYHGSRLGLNAPYAAELARKQAVDLYGDSAYTDGYQVFTTVSSELQNRAQQAVIHGLLAYDARHGYRGPEKNLATGGAPAKPTPATLEQWKLDLEAIPTYGGLKPAVVIDTPEQSLSVMTSAGETLAIAWENGLAQARPYINENSIGAKPSRTADFLKTGDVVRIVKNPDEQWQLTQVPTAQAALIALAPEDGAIQAVVGGFDFNQSNFNRASQAERQPGSSFKPFIYTIGLENGLTPASLINDAPIVFEDSNLENSWRPENDSGKFLGPTRLRQALYQSRNIVSIRILQSVGVSKAIRSMERFGFDPKKLPQNLSLALGSHAVTPLQIAAGYAIFANGGYRVEPYLVDHITDLNGNTLYRAAAPRVCSGCTGDLSSNPPQPDSITGAAQATNPPARRVVDERTAYLINDMLQDVVRKGTGRGALKLGRSDLAGKTGTTNGPTDAWFSGYNSKLVATAWVGFDQNTSLGRREYGGSAALPIWIEFMRHALKNIPDSQRPQPDGLVTIKIDPKTGLKAMPGDPNAIFEIFRREDVPQDNISNTHSQSDTGALPTDIF